MNEPQNVRLGLPDGRSIAPSEVRHDHEGVSERWHYTFRLDDEPRFQPRTVWWSLRSVGQPGGGDSGNSSSV